MGTEIHKLKSHPFQHFNVKTWEKSKRESRNLIPNDPNQENTTFLFSHIRIKFVKVNDK